MILDNETITFNGLGDEGVIVTSSQGAHEYALCEDGEPVTFKLSYEGKAVVVVGHFAPHLCHSNGCGWIWSTGRLAPLELFDCEGSHLISEEGDKIIALLSIAAPKGTTIERIGWGWEDI